MNLKQPRVHARHVIAGRDVLRFADERVEARRSGAAATQLLLHRPRATDLLYRGMAIRPPPAGFHGPVKRSVTIAGHATSISLEPVFWRAIEEAAAARRCPLSALIAEIDALRIVAADPPNLASALRTWVLSIASENYSQQG